MTAAERYAAAAAIIRAALAAGRSTVYVDGRTLRGRVTMAQTAERFEALAEGSY